MKHFKKSIGLLVLITLFVGLVGCSSGDPLTDASKIFTSISRIERQNPGGMQFTEEQAKQLLEIINPVLAGMPYTPDLAGKMVEEAEKLLTKEQKQMIEEVETSLGTPGEGGVPGSGGGSGTGMPGSGGGTPGSGEGANMFFRLDQIITENYLSN